MNSKDCTKCSKHLPLSEYYIITNKNTGKKYHYTYCKKCHYEKMTKHTSAKWRKDNPDSWNKAVRKATAAYFKRQKAGVYLLVTDIGLYVGASDKLTSRISQHNGNTPGNVRYKGAKILYSKVLAVENDKKERLRIEKEWIQKLQPALNIIHTDKYQTYFQLKKKK